jgi:hypothetical protein
VSLEESKLNLSADIVETVETGIDFVVESFLS